MRRYKGPIFEPPDVGPLAEPWRKATGRCNTTGSSCIYVATGADHRIFLWSSYDECRGVIHTTQEALRELITVAKAGGLSKFDNDDAPVDITVTPFTFRSAADGKIEIRVNGVDGLVRATWDEVGDFVDGMVRKQFDDRAGLVEIPTAD